MLSNCEICNIKILCDVHHIQSKSKGGKNLKNNKCILCPNCHRLVHIGNIILEGRFKSTAGDILVWRKKEDDPITDHLPNVYII